MSRKLVKFIKTKKGETVLSVSEITSKLGKVSYSIDDCTGNFAETDNYTTWGTVVKNISSKQLALDYADYLLDCLLNPLEDNYDEFSIWKKNQKRLESSPLSQFADKQEYDFSSNTTEFENN